MTVVTSCRALSASAQDAIPRVLVVGGGIGGMSCAIGLRRLGCSVDLVEQDPDWRVYGAGITITGPSFRAFKSLGLLPELLARGFGTQQPARLHTGDGQLLHQLPAQALAADLPCSGGILRPILHEILSERVKAEGVAVRLGVTVADWLDEGDRVHVNFTDSMQADYALVVAADGAFSKARTRLFPAAPVPQYTGQYCWRLLAERPAEVNGPLFFMTGQSMAGLMPISATQMYMWVLQAVAEKVWIDPATQHLQLAQVMQPFGGLLARLRDGLTQDSIINCRPLEAVLLPAPWHKGRIILIGDAAHATTPHLASGAGMAVEDGLVLCELLQEHTALPAAFTAFMQRRWERCRLVVENSVAIGAMQQQPNSSPDKLQQLMSASERVLREEI